MVRLLMVTVVGDGRVEGLGGVGLRRVAASIFRKSSGHYKR